MRLSIVGLGVASLALALLATAATAASEDELAEIRKIVAEQQETIRALTDRIEELEGRPVPPPVAAAPAPAEGAPPSPVEEAERQVRLGKRARVLYRGTLNDRQSAAARAGDYTLDPDYRGFIPVPNTAVMVKFNAKPRVDFVFDSGDPGTEFRFVPSLFPSSTESGFQVGANANATQLIVDVQAPSVEGTPRFYYQNDFFGSNDSHMRFRLQHLYGEYYGFLGGFTYGVFEDPDAWPDTVDYEGTNSLVFARRPVVQYKREIFDDLQLTLAVEDPDIYVDVSRDENADVRSRAPDTGFALEWTPGELGHMRVSTILRSLSVDGDEFGDDDVFGWGINTSGSLRLSARDTMQYYFVYGHGVGGMGNDTSFINSDAAFSAPGELEALEYWSAMLAMTHEWSPRWRSTLTYGYVNLENTPLQDADFYHSSHYTSVNLMYQMFKRLRVGVEGLYGHKEVRDGSTSDLFRFQVGVAWALF